MIGKRTFGTKSDEEVRECRGNEVAFPNIEEGYYSPKDQR